MSALPSLSVYQRQRGHKVCTAWIRNRLLAALPLCLEHLTHEKAPLALLHEVEASIVSDKTIAEVHAQFLNDPTPTDVITFHHGEILVSADTAALAAPLHGHSLDVELLLYLIHGLMHLAGWEDEEPAEHDEMHRRQNAVLAAVLAAGSE
jgi:probable rRNA maturation factor